MGALISLGISPGGSSSSMGWLITLAEGASFVGNEEEDDDQQAGVRWKRLVDHKGNRFVLLP